MNTVAPSPAIAASSAPAETRARTQAMEFESVFLNAMLSPMFETLGEESFGGAGASTWRSLLVEEYAGAIAGSGGIGIADTVYAEILALQEAASPQLPK